METAGVVVVVAAGVVEMSLPKSKRSMTGAAAGEVEAGPVRVVLGVGVVAEGEGAVVIDEVEAEDTDEDEAEVAPRLFTSSRPSSSSSCAFSLSSSLLSSSADLPPFTNASGSLWNTEDSVEICMI